jgi:hypothetical protein
MGWLGKKRWIAATALVFAAGCLATHVDQPQLQFVEIPPAVRAAFLANYHSSAIRSITCEAKGTQYFYTLTYVDGDSRSHTVVLNEGGDEINQY